MVKARSAQSVYRLEFMDYVVSVRRRRRYSELAKPLMKTEYICSSEFCEARSGGDPTLAASQKRLPQRADSLRLP
jgi:hypothetical protein